MNSTGRPKGARTRPLICELRKKLILRGYRSINDWGQRYGFSTRTVHRTLSRYYGVEGVEPYGAQGILILAALEATLAEPEMVIRDRRSGSERRTDPGRRAENHCSVGG